MPTSPRDLLIVWVDRQVTPEGQTWFAALRTEANALPAAFAQARRRMGQARLILDGADREAADRARRGWRPQHLTLEQAARIVLLLEAGGDAPDLQLLRNLISTADVSELLAIYKGLPVYPHANGLVSIATDGLRTSIPEIFAAVAHHNPFPADHLPEAAWNQMVLKALFIDVPLEPIVGLDQRWNANLAQKLCDYVHERWAAKRAVNPQIWRGVGRFAGKAEIGDLAKVLVGEDDIARKAAALALSECPHPAAARLLDDSRELVGAIATGNLTWAHIGHKSESARQEA
jgi:hypothetical protein